MRRLTVTLGHVVILALGALTVPPAADPQPPPKAPRIGVLAISSPSYGTPLLDAFRQGLRGLGYGDIVIEARWAEGRFERLPDLAAELVRLKTAHGEGARADDFPIAAAPGGSVGPVKGE